MVFAQGGDFAGCQMTPRARSQPGQADGPDPHAGQFGNGMPDSKQHAPHLTVTPFKNGEFYLGAAVVVVPGVLARRRLCWGDRYARTHRPDRDVFRAAREAVFQHHAPAQSSQGIGGRDAAHFRPVRFGDMVLGVRHLIQKVAVVCQKDQALAFLVQPPHRAQHGAGRQLHQVGDKTRGMHVTAGRNDPARLVQGDVIVFGRRADRPSIKHHFVHTRLDFRA